MNQSEFINEATVLAGLFGLELEHTENLLYLLDSGSWVIIGIYANKKNGEYSLDTAYHRQTVTTQRLYDLYSTNYKRLLLWLKLFMVKYTNVRNQANEPR